MTVVAVGGAVAAKAANGGEAWVRLSYALGLRRLGYDVRLVEEAPNASPEAVGYARRNVVEPGVVLVGDLYDPLPSGLRGRVDLLVANAPYVPTGAIALMPREARDHEPQVALDGGVDGVDVQRRIIAEAPGWLRAGGSLLIETGREQSLVTAGEMRAVGLRVEVVVDDDRDGTVVIGTTSIPRCRL